MGRGFNSQIIRREKSEIVQIVRPTVSPPPQKKPACLLARSLALSFAFAASEAFTRAQGANVVSTSLTVKKADIK